MPDDILDRLLNYSGPVWQLKKDPMLFTDAAREIARLRHARTLWKGTALRFRGVCVGEWVFNEAAQMQAEAERADIEP